MIITEQQALGIAGNVEGRNVVGGIEHVIYAARKSGASEVVISRTGCPVIGDDTLWGADQYLTVMIGQ